MWNDVCFRAVDAPLLLVIFIRAFLAYTDSQVFDHLHITVLFFKKVLIFSNTWAWYLSINLLTFKCKHVISDTPFICLRQKANIHSCIYQHNKLNRSQYSLYYSLSFLSNARHAHSHHNCYVKCGFKDECFSVESCLQHTFLWSHDNSNENFIAASLVRSYPF